MKLNCQIEDIEMVIGSVSKPSDSKKCVIYDAMFLNGRVSLRKFKDLKLGHTPIVLTKSQQAWTLLFAQVSRQIHVCFACVLDDISFCIVAVSYLLFQNLLNVCVLHSVVFIEVCERACFLDEKSH